MRRDNCINPPKKRDTDMDEREVVATLTYLAGARQQFRLSELRQYLSEALPLPDLAALVAPHLPGLNLAMSDAGGDYQISRLQKAVPFIPTDADRERQESFFASPKVPERFQQLFEDYVAKKTGKDWDDPVVLERIRNAILAQKSTYWDERPDRTISYRKGYQVLAYLTYHLPVSMVQCEHILWQLASDGLFKTRMTILDVGTGPGTVPLAVIDLLDRLEDCRAEIHTVEQSEENLEAFRAIVPPAAKMEGKVRVMPPIQTDLLSISPSDLPKNIDLMVFSSVLNELRTLSVSERADLVSGLMENLAEDGTLLIIEPADLVNSTTLRETALALVGHGLGIYSPCSFLWGTRCRAERCWSFEQKGNMQPTRLMVRVSEGREAYRYLNTDIKYSYAIIRKDRSSRRPYRVPRGAKFARFSDLHRHRDREINVVGVLVSGNLGDKDGGFFKLCDGTPAKPVYAAVNPHLPEEIRDALQGVPYGDIVELFGVVVRYNKDHDAYNLVVTRNTRIRRVPCSVQG
jgi:hypothetical protein